MPGITVQGVPLLVYGTGRLAYTRVLLYAFSHECNRRKGAIAPLGTPGGPQVKPKVLVAQHTEYHYKHEHILISASFSRPNISCPIL